MTFICIKKKLHNIIIFITESFMLSKSRTNRRERERERESEYTVNPVYLT